ncbi:MAG: TetR/AcrR family transcriptional regulator [Proteobacteria bacterium]|nr:TetR/AcrR family transcriptional regulator [Pseudomonadota bacterium]
MEEKILQASMDIFARQGYRGLSIKRITDKLGLSKAAFYAHFQSKNELLHRLIDEFERQYLDELIHRIQDHPGTAIDKIHRAMSFGSELGFKHPELIICYQTLNSELRAVPDFEPALTRVRCKQELFLTDLFSQGVREGLLRNDLDPGTMAKVFIALSAGMFQQWIFQQSHIDGNQYIRAIRRLVFEGLLAWR